MCGPWSSAWGRFFSWPQGTGYLNDSQSATRATPTTAAMIAVFSSSWLVAAVCCCAATVAGDGGDPAGLPLGGPL